MRTIALLLAREARDRIEDLLRYGVPFDKDLEGHLDFAREAAHGARRILHVKGDTAGRAIMAALTVAARATPSIQVLEGWGARDLVIRDGQVAGIEIARVDANPFAPSLVLDAAAVVLATGGSGQLYAITTNPRESRGEGIAIAARAGATIADAEFVQFHPTAINVGRDPAPLATESLRGEGALLINGRGERFMRALHPDAELGPRDIVARGVYREVMSGRGAFLDCRKIGPEFPARFPTVFAACEAAGLDPRREPIPIAPAAHYHMGGVYTDANGRTTIEGLWACGEVASTGAHGANRLASNSLLEAVVFGARVAGDIAERLPSSEAIALDISAAPIDRSPSEPDSQAVQTLRRTMTGKVGVIRDDASLVSALRNHRRPQAKRGIGPAPRQHADHGQAHHHRRADAQREPRGAFPQRLPRSRPEACPSQPVDACRSRARRRRCGERPRAGPEMGRQSQCMIAEPAKLELPPFLVERAVAAALEEDLGQAGDITTDPIIPPHATAEAEIVARKAGVIAGLDLAAASFKALDPDAQFVADVADGAHVAAGARLARVQGKARALLSAERVALNFLGHLSGIATLTAAYVAAIEGTKARIACTRKTTPGLRAFEKYAVRAGGGINHRFGLYDAVLVKDNHIAAAGGLAQALAKLRARTGHLVKVEVEVDTLDQLDEALHFPIDAVLLDNMDVATLKKAVAMVDGRVLTEASGGVNLQTVRKIAETGVDLISVGALTHSAPRLDLALEWR